MNDNGGMNVKDGRNGHDGRLPDTDGYGHG
jgi:hypothetical protein